MSHEANDLGWHLARINRLAQDLLHNVDLLTGVGQALIVGEPWNDAKSKAISEAICSWADDCARSLHYAHRDVLGFFTSLDAVRNIEVSGGFQH